MFSSSVPIRALHWQAQTSVSICWTPPLPSYPRGKLKQDRKTYFSLPPLSSALSSLHCCPRQPRSNSELLTHAPSLCRRLPFGVSVCVSSSNVRGVSLLQHVQYHTTGPHNPDDSSNDARKARDGGMWGRMALNYQCRVNPFVFFFPYSQYPLQPIKHTTHKHTHAH